ncbi:MAG: hypothetical protein BGP01_10745 [Paludibacter sp. 47-17]|nr:MAG: hypothetical protein BGP01_10745 [Paludibacter sp. 47-17]
MKTKQIFSLVLTVLVLTSSMVVAQTKAGSDKVVFDVNMHCEACQKKIEKNIAFEKGVKAMEVSLENKTVALNYDAKKTSPEKLQAALVKLGYTAKVKDDKACCDKAAASAGCQAAKPASEVKSDCQAKATGECKDKAKSECKEKAAGCCDKAKTADKAGCQPAAADCKADKKCSDSAKTAEAPKAGCCSEKKSV